MACKTEIDINTNPQLSLQKVAIARLHLDYFATYASTGKFYVCSQIQKIFKQCQIYTCNTPTYEI